MKVRELKLGDVVRYKDNLTYSFADMMVVKIDGNQIDMVRPYLVASKTWSHKEVRPMVGFEPISFVGDSNMEFELLGNCKI